MKYASQKIGYYFLLVSMSFFLFQAGQTFIFQPETYSQQFDSIIACLLMAINGAAYYIIPEEAKRDTYSTKLAYIHLAILVAINMLINLHFHNHVAFSYLLIGSFALGLGNLGYTLWKSHTYTATSMILLLGFLLAGLLYISELFNVRPHRPISYWQQWVTDLCVEGILELIMGSLLGFVLIKLTDARETIEFWLYVMVCFCFIIGLLGNPSYSFTNASTSWFSFSVKYGKDILHLFASLAFLGMIVSALTLARKNPKHGSELH